MQEMTAIAIREPGGPEVLVPVKLPVPDGTAVLVFATAVQGDPDKQLYSPV